MPATRKIKPTALPSGRYLQRFTLENARTFRSMVTLDFRQSGGSIAQWTVILGENGTGKTTLLQYLAGTTPFDRGEFPSNRTDKPSEPQFFYGPLLANHKWMPWHADNISIQGDDSAMIRANLFFSESVTSLTNTASKCGGSHPVTLEVGGGKIIGSHPIPMLRKTWQWSSSNKEIRDELHIFAYGASRHIAGPASPYLSSESFFKNGGSEPTSTLFHDDYPLISPEQWLLGLHHTSSGEGTEAKAAKRSYDSACRCLINTLPGIHDIGVRQRKAGKGLPNMTVMCKTVYGEVSFSALSLGYRTMAAWLIDFVKRMHETYPDLKEPDDGPAVVLIDEFDLHMHPKWQREAMAALSREFPNTQFIVTAHSPLVVQAAGNDTKIVVLRRQKREDGTEEVVIDAHPRSATGWRLDQILQSLYGLPPFSPQHEELMRQRVELRQKEKLTPTERKKLATIEDELDAIESTGKPTESEQLLRELKEALEKVKPQDAKKKRKS